MDFEPFNVEILNVDEFIKQNGVLEVTSSFIFEPSSKTYNPDGLFSEEIFGELGTEDRFEKIGYIKLNTKVYNPYIFKTICKLKTLYKNIMSGNEYVTFDESIKDFVPVDNTSDKAKTGYKYFIDNFEKVKLVSTNSRKRKDAIKILKQYQNNWYVTKQLIMPAGFRDFQLNDYSQEAINKVYNGLINYSRAILNNGNSEIYNNTRFGIQKKIYEIYQYIENLMTGKHGIMQGKYIKRGIALGTRNVIATVSTSDKSPENPQYLKADEVLIPLFEAAKMFQPYVIYYLKKFFFDYIFNAGTGQVILVNPDTLTISYDEITNEDREQFLSSDGLQGFIDRFRNTDIRDNPVQLVLKNGELRYFKLIYDLDDKFIVVKSKENLINNLHEGGLQFEESRLHPITYAEMIYIATQCAVNNHNLHCTITRYPVLTPNSIFVAKVKLATTIESTTKYLTSSIMSKELQESLKQNVYYAFPIKGKPYINAISTHHRRMSQLNSDFDGDTVSAIGILSKEGNQEASDYLNNKQNVINLNGQLTAGLNTDLCKLTLYNLTKNNIV